ncbi:MAG TPA: WYL domain-containing protein [Candidatus Lumbricidophila sp.]|nr:WYL domain-containing protein [Candidatus Lumbricidophila sp.]
MAAETARDRVPRLLTIVGYLLRLRQEFDIVTVTEAAEHLGLPAQQIRDDVKLIAMSGIPGATGNYEHNDLFDIDWGAFEDDDLLILQHSVAVEAMPKFSSREASALIAGLAYLSEQPGFTDSTQLASLRAKLAAGASAAPTSVLVAPGLVDAAVGTLREAIAAGQQVAFDYLTGGESRTRRTVDPQRLVSDGPIWTLQGWCHTRQGHRSFRLDRMTHIEVLPDAADEHPEPPTPGYQGSQDDLVVNVELPLDALPLIAGYVVGARQEPIGDRVRVTLRFAHEYALKRLVAGFPGVITVISPAAAKHAVADWADRGLAQYDA